MQIQIKNGNLQQEEILNWIWNLLWQTTGGVSSFPCRFSSGSHFFFFGFRPIINPDGNAVSPEGGSPDTSLQAGYIYQGYIQGN